MSDIDGAVVDDTVRDMEAEPPSIEAPIGHPKLPGIVEALKSVFDPEIPVNIYELGLIYKIEINEANDVALRMTLTAPACPVAGAMPQQVADAVAAVPGVGEVEVNLVWEPGWTKDRMSEDAKLALDIW
jgi:FeS assembly SUF system protein